MVLVLALAVLGYLWLLLANEPWEADGLTMGFLAVAVGVTFGAWWALSLAALNDYSIAAWSLYIAALIIVCIVVAYRKRRWRLALARCEPKPALILPWGERTIPRRLEGIALFGWLALASVLYFRPHEMILGFNDAGVYLHLGTSIAERGQIRWEDELLAELPPTLRGAFYRDLDEEWTFSPYYLMPAFYVPDAGTAEIVPQFYHLHSAWLALAYDVGGTRLMLYMTGFWGLLAGLAFYLTVRELFGWETGFLALLALTISALQVWFARYPTTEMLSQFLLWAGVFCLGKWLGTRTNRGVWGVLAGLFWGALFLARIDAYFILAIPALLLIWRWLAGDVQRADWGLLLMLVGLTLQSLAHGAFVSTVYFQGLFQYGIWLVQFNPLPFVGLALAGLIVLTLAWRYRHIIVATHRWESPVKQIAMASVLIWGIYNWFIRINTTLALPEYNDWIGNSVVPILDRENLLRLGWYLAPTGIWLAVAGMLWLIWGWRKELLPLFGVGLIFTLLYIWRIQANPHQVYVMRRYVPAVVPFFMAATAALTMGLYRQGQWRRWLALLLAGVWFVGLAWNARGFLSVVDHEGLREAFIGLDAQLEPESIILFANPDDGPLNFGDTVGGPLRFWHGHDVLMLRESSGYDGGALQTQIGQWLADERTVYWVGELPADYESLAIGESFTYTIESQSLERSYEHKPATLTDHRWVFAINRIESVAAD